MKISKTNVLYITVFLVFQFNAFAQTRISTAINWAKSTENTHTVLNDYAFENAQIIDETAVPYFSDQFRVSKLGDVNFKIVDYISEVTKIKTEQDIPSLPIIKSFVSQERENFFAVYSFTPFIRNRSTGQIEKITQIELEYQFTPLSTSSSRQGPEFKTASLLKDGAIYKVAVAQSGIHKITFAQLGEMGIDLSSINPKQIQLLGNKGGMNPEANDQLQNDDLTENAIYIQGEDDGRFDESDFILFYAHGPHSWTKDAYVHNLYSDHNYYFLKIGSEEGLRVKNRASVPSNNFAASFDTYKRYEKDAYNLLSDYAPTQGSGKIWFSDKYTSNRNQDFTSFFEDPNLDIDFPVNLEVQFASRSRNSSRVDILVDGIENQISFNGVNISNIESRYADLEKKSFVFSVSKPSPKVVLEFPNSISESTGWLDYIHMEYRAQLSYNGSPVVFRRFDSDQFDDFGFQIQTGNQNPVIWDITDPEKVVQQEHDNFTFGYHSSNLHEFVVFDPAASHRTVEFIEEIENQNLHAIEGADAIIIYHPDFEEAAEKLARHRADFSDLNVVAVPVTKVYNEFSSGRVDVPGIRNFARMIYERDSDFRFLTLLGDGSFDYKHIEKDFSDDNFIPVYETLESMSPISAFPSDDFYALLDEQEGGTLRGGLDIAVGRIPVRSPEKAISIVDKIIDYDTSEDAFTDWRLRIGFAADDEDRNIHLRDADGIAERSRFKYPDFNVEKIYFDAFPQVSTPGGERYPQATSAINNNIFKGLLTLCYLGHGGPKGWAQERVLKLDDLENWDNKHKLPLLITATCSFTGYDSPKTVSAGELVFLKEETGAIALMSTVRAVYVNQNERLTRSVFDTIFTKDAGEFMGLGEILRRAKNSNAADTIDVNARKFQLIGDPSQKLAIPEHKIITSKINGILVDESYEADTVKALQKMIFEGFVADENGSILSDFNGIVYASVFDKLIESKTLANNTTSSERVFNIQKTILFKGQSAVENGRFRFEFYLPSAINFKYGNGKISLYAKSGTRDASGKFDNFIIGGSEDTNIDDSPPVVDVFLNTEEFVFGGLSTSDPVLLVKLQDDFGINVAGLSVGHDLVAELDNNSNERYILNDFYETELNDFRRGTVRFPLKDIEAGKHTIKIKAFDLSNNLGEGYTEFIVSDDLGESLKHVLNYPNPFSTRTTFMFEHNLPGSELEILIDIYNMSGQVVKTIELVVLDDGFRIDGISWDGRDDYGQKIANGVYLYKIKVFANQLGIKKESNFEKLVILK